MNPERKDFLSLPTPPARMLAEEAAWYLGFTVHDIPVLVSAGLLKPLGRPPMSGTKFFATATLRELREDVKWLAKASDAIVHHWRVRNARKKESGDLTVLRAVDEPHSTSSTYSSKTVSCK